MNSVCQERLGGLKRWRELEHSLYLLELQPKIFALRRRSEFRADVLLEKVVNAEAVLFMDQGEVMALY